MFTSDRDLRKPVPKKTTAAKATASKPVSLPSGSAAQSSQNNIATSAVAVPSVFAASSTGASSTIPIVERARLERNARQYQSNLQIHAVLIQCRWRSILTQRRLLLDNSCTLSARLDDIAKLEQFMRQQKKTLSLPASTAQQFLRTALFLCSDRNLQLHQRLLVLHRQIPSSQLGFALQYPWDLLMQVARCVAPILSPFDASIRSSSSVGLSFEDSSILQLVLRTILLLLHLLSERFHGAASSEQATNCSQSLVLLCTPLLSYLQQAKSSQVVLDISDVLVEAVRCVLWQRASSKLLQLSEEDARVATVDSLRQRAQQPVSLESLFLYIYIPLVWLSCQSEGSFDLQAGSASRQISPELTHAVRRKVWMLPLWPVLLSESSLLQLIHGQTSSISRPISPSSVQSLARLSDVLVRDMHLLSSHYHYLCVQPEESMSNSRKSTRTQQLKQQQQNEHFEKDTARFLQSLLDPLPLPSHGSVSSVYLRLIPKFVSEGRDRYLSTMRLKFGSLLAGIVVQSSFCYMLPSLVSLDLQIRSNQKLHDSVKSRVSQFTDSCISALSRLLIMFPLISSALPGAASVPWSNESDTTMNSSVLRVVAIPSVCIRGSQQLLEPTMLRLLVASTVRDLQSYHSHTSNSISSSTQVGREISESVLRKVTVQSRLPWQELCSEQDLEEIRRVLEQSETQSSAHIVRDTLRSQQQQHLQQQSMQYMLSSWAQKLGLSSSTSSSSAAATSAPSSGTTTVNQQSNVSTWFSFGGKALTNTAAINNNANQTLGPAIETRRMRFLLVLRLFSILLFAGCDSGSINRSTSFIAATNTAVWRALSTLCHGTPLVSQLLCSLLLPETSSDEFVWYDDDEEENEEVESTKAGSSNATNDYNSSGRRSRTVRSGKDSSQTFAKRWSNAVGRANIILNDLIADVQSEVWLALSLCRVVPPALLLLSLNDQQIPQQKASSQSIFGTFFKSLSASSNTTSSYYNLTVSKESQWLSFVLLAAILQHSLVTTDDTDLYSSKGTVPLSLYVPLIRHYTGLLANCLPILLQQQQQTSNSSEVEPSVEEERDELDPLLSVLARHLRRVASRNILANSSSLSDKVSQTTRTANIKLNDATSSVTLLNCCSKELVQAQWRQQRARRKSVLLVFVSALLRDLHSRWARRAFSASTALFHIGIQTTSTSAEATDRFTSLLLQHIPHTVPLSQRLQRFRSFLDTQRLSVQGSAPQVTLMSGLFGASQVTGGFRTAGTVLTVRRSRLLQDALSQLNQAEQSLDVWRDRFVVRFIDDFGNVEAGQDAGGLFKDFFTTLSEQVFHPNFGLFALTADHLLYPNPAAGLLITDKHELEQTFRFIGRVLGKALYENIAIAPQFAHFFLAQLQQHKDSLLSLYTQLVSELATFDAELAKNLLFLKNYDGDISLLDLSFSVTDTLLGQVVERDLIPQGRDCPVTNVNRHQYVALVAKYYLYDRLQPQAGALLQGLRDLVPTDYLSLFSAAEWQLVISGDTAQTKAEIIRDLQAHVQYAGGYFALDPVILRFWQVLQRDDWFNAQDLSLLLQFVTACPRPPSLGFAALTPAFTIQRCSSNNSSSSGDVEQLRLPTASTCFNVLKLPPYPTAELMRDKLQQAIRSKSGFDLA